MRKARAKRITPPKFTRIITYWFNIIAFRINETVEKVSQLGLTTTGRENGTSGKRSCLRKTAEKGTKN